MSRRTLFKRRKSRSRFYRGAALSDSRRPKSRTSQPLSDNQRWSPKQSQVRARRRTRGSLVVSVSLHLIAVLTVSISLPRWYQPPPPEPIIAELIEVELQPTRLHPVAIKKPVFQDYLIAQPHASAARSTQFSPPKALAVQASPVDPSVRLEVKPLGTTAHLLSTSETPFTETVEDDWGLEESIGEPLEVATEIATESPQPVTTPIEQNLSQIQRPQPGADSAQTQSIDRDAQLGSTFQTIASGIASGKHSPTVDIVFLLDTSGSMEDNIRAVGRNLIAMVRIFREEQLDFTMAVVPFKYLTQHFHQPTKDYEKYERLLENVQCGGAERAYNAIVKSITRIQFRPGARRRFILITDAPFTGSYTTQEVLQRCRAAKITIDVIGGVTDRGEDDNPFDARHLQKVVARKTGGNWFPIPGN